MILLMYSTSVNNQFCRYPGSFILMNIQVVKKDTRIHRKATEINKILFNFGVEGLCVRSRMMKPRPPREKRKLDASPSMMYCPFTRFGIKATGRLCPCSSVVEPTLGGSTITSYIIPTIKNTHYNQSETNPMRNLLAILQNNLLTSGH